MRMPSNFLVFFPILCRPLLFVRRPDYTFTIDIVESPGYITSQVPFLRDGIFEANEVISPQLP